jgi:hypothetical protein
MLEIMPVIFNTYINNEAWVLKSNHDGFGEKAGIKGV